MEAPRPKAASLLPLPLGKATTGSTLPDNSVLVSSVSTAGRTLPDALLERNRFVFMNLTPE